MHGYAMPKFFGRAATRPSKVWQNWRAHLLMRRNFFGSAVAPPSKTFRHSLLATRCCFTIRHSLFAIRHRSRLGRSLALPIFPVPRPTTLVLLKVGAQFLRHQLRTKVRSMICFWLHHQLGLMSPVSLARIHFKSQRTCSISKRRKGR
jgi:hypothetical protein